MKKNLMKITFLLIGLLAMDSTMLFAADDEKETEVKNDADNSFPVLIINGTNRSATFTVSSDALKEEAISIVTPSGFTVSPQSIPANGKKQKVTVTLNSTLALTEGKIILKSGEKRSYIKVKGYGSALPIKDLSSTPLYQGKNEKEFSQTFNPSKNGYTIEFKMKACEAGQAFYPYFVDKEGYGVKAYFAPNEIGLFSSTRKKAIANPTTSKRAGGSGKFYDNEREFYTYRFAVTPDHRAFIYRDGMPIDTIRLADFGPQPNFANGRGEMVDNLLKNPDFEGEYEIDPGSKLASHIEGWDIVINDRWNSEQQILPQEINKELDVDNHIFQIKPYKWSGSTWSDGILEQVVDVEPNETYTLTALVKGGISKKKAVNTGKMVIQEVQASDKSATTEIVSSSWELYSMDYTTSSECKQLRIAFRVGRGGWGNDISAVQVDKVSLTGVSRTYSSKFGFEDSTAELEYFTIDESGAYAPAQPTININIE